MVPMNLLPAGGSADYIVTGVWGQKAVKEAKRVGAVKIAGVHRGRQLSRACRTQSELTLDPSAAYVHMTSNNTIYGTEWHWLPDVGEVPLVSDISSDMFSRPIDVSKHALIYAGAQKNLAPGRRHARDHPRRHAEAVAGLAATMLSYSVHAENQSMYNTPPVFAIYVMRLVMTWLLKQGGLGGDREASTRGRPTKLYAEIDRTGFYRGHAEKDSRSRMNVTFRLPSEDLEKKFAKEATAAGLDGLKGHRSVGGMRASIYNAFPEAGVDALVGFMQEFERKNG